MNRDKDRRRFFRIDDQVNLYYKKVDEATVTPASHMSDNVLGNCSLSAALELISQESRIMMHRLDRTMPDVADYLKLIESKIDLIAQAIMMQGTDFKEKDTRNANLSASGLAFESAEALAVGDYLEIKMLLVSCMAVIVTYGRVIYCKPKKNPEGIYSHIIGVDYVNMKEQDRELLIRHVVKRQMQKLRENKEP
ncbi:PilZ domain-containing protein [Methylotuvimicrobium alcaliphilum]|uniref:Type IV pilus assembly PilZ n=1 Tax=Methylotuvimicrobium alcaliphilum (strain DSM 19304 / NCIMB 14124 / VKM B-2133 / 20Z) TaxID=1091494 RepID=G4T2V0_META2|nr:PilZ domain-containing protein [Methylotuvimicrobium alcaliphilum]CCE23603.1 Type IV pilus assembly PilZ [Methylotuvimicrobium alcaliphilum 20Z]